MRGTREEKARFHLLGENLENLETALKFFKFNLVR